jgi:quercetin dioxygenase-like cupin family protein
MEDIMMRRIALVAAPALLIAGVAVGSGFADAQQLQRKVLLQQDAPPGFQTVLTSVEFPPGASEIRHTHPGMLVVYVIEGTLVVESEGRPRTTYKPGDSFYIEAGKVHQGINSSTAPVKIVAMQVAEKGKPLSTPAP